MKKILIITSAIAVAMLSACNGGQVAYNITVSGAEDGASVILTDLVSGEVLDTQEIADGQLCFTGKADKDALLSISVPDSEWELSVFADGEDVKVNIEDGSVEGSETNEKVAAYNKEALDAYSKVLQAIQEYEELEPEEQAVRALEINAMIAGLTETERTCLELRNAEGLSLDEIAEATGKPKTSVKSTISVARRKMLEKLKQEL